MIQRVQTLFLLLAGALLIAFLVFSNAWAGGIAPTLPWLAPTVLVAAGLTAAVSLTAMLFYKDRARQRTVILAGQWLAVLTVAGVLTGLIVSIPDADGSIFGRVATALLPVAAYVMLRLARRGVEKDIDLVKSMDRLR